MSLMPLATPLTQCGQYNDDGSECMNQAVGLIPFERMLRMGMLRSPVCADHNPDTTIPVIRLTRTEAHRLALALVVMHQNDVAPEFTIKDGQLTFRCEGLGWVPLFGKMVGEE